MNVDGESEQRYELGLLPDSPEVRRFIELAHYAGGDLSPASAALHRAAEFVHEDDLDTARFLVDSAVVAYCRAFVPSKIRQPLDQLVAIPDSFADTHAAIRTYRNTTVAHSQSELSATWPIVIVDRIGEEPPRVVEHTISQPLPLALVRRFTEMVDALLDEAERLTSTLRKVLEDSLRSGGAIKPLAPELVVHAPADSDFTARADRRIRLVCCSIRHPMVIGSRPSGPMPAAARSSCFSVHPCSRSTNRCPRHPSHPTPTARRCRRARHPGTPGSRCAGRRPRSRAAVSAHPP